MVVLHAAYVGEIPASLRSRGWKALTSAEGFEGPWSKINLNLLEARNDRG